MSQRLTGASFSQSRLHISRTAFGSRPILKRKGGAPASYFCRRMEIRKGAAGALLEGASTWLRWELKTGISREGNLDL